jgi:DNA-binding HxlR family transcriptional regulator
MHTPLSIAIAKQLANSNVGLFRIQLFDKIDSTLTNKNIEAISRTLNAMKTDGHVSKSATQGANGCRWSLTPKGRASYSELNADHDQPTAETPEKNRADITIQDDQADEKQLDTATDISPEPSRNTRQIMQFDLSDTLDRALYGMVKLIRDAASHEQQPIVIDNKADAMELLESMEKNPIINGPHRATFYRIRQAVNQMENAS